MGKYSSNIYDRVGGKKEKLVVLYGHKGELLLIESRQPNGHEVTQLNYKLSQQGGHFKIAICHRDIEICSIISSA